MVGNLYPLLLKQYEEHPKMPIGEALKLVGGETPSAQDFLRLVSRIEGLLKLPGPVLMAIDGNSCAGKSTLARLLQRIYQCNVFHMDDFFLPLVLKTKERLMTPGGNVHYERFLEEVIAELHRGEEFSYRPYSCQQQSLGKEVLVQPQQLNIIEGAYSMHPTLVANYDLKIFLEIDAEDQSQRVLKRNGPTMHERFINEWIPMENRYFQELRIREQCDLVLHG